MVDRTRVQQRLLRSLKASTANPYRVLGVVFFSSLILLLFGFLTDIPWHLQTLKSGFQYWDNALFNGITGIYIGGFTGFLLTVIYSILGGFALTNAALQLRDHGIATKELGGILPGFVAAGCASCGVGLIGILGVSGSAALFPLGGNLFKAAGIMLILYSLYEFGEPGVCEI